MKYGDRDGHGQHGILDDDGQTLLCHECGKRYISLSAHLRSHGMSSAMYRAAHGLSPALPLWSTQYRAHQRARSQKQYQNRPDIQKSLAGGRALAAASGAGTRTAADQAPTRRGRAAVRQAQSAHTSRLNASRGDRERARQEAVARADGYPDLRAWLIAHQSLSDRLIAERLGVSRSRAGVLRLHAAGPRRKNPKQRAAAVAQVLAGATAREVATRIGVSPDAVRGWVRAATPPS
ncbi:MucR family transcriptional regulator [Streptomyces sp. NPDC002559]